MLGDIDTDPYDTSDKIFLYFFTGISLCMIMLNLIVALLSNTYLRVMASEKEISLRELNFLVITYEIFGSLFTQ
jgi:hypothetical protein